MLTLSTATAAAVAAPSTAPRYLMLIESTPALRLTNGATCTWGGHTWTASAFFVDSIEALPSGGTRGTLQFLNHDLAFGALVLTGAADLPVTIWAVYGDGPHAADDPVLELTGAIDEAEIVGVTRVRMTIEATASEYSHLPRHRVAPPVFNHLPPAGTTFTWGGETYELVSR